MRLLELVRETGSISAAGRAMGMSYRRAWLLVESLNASLANLGFAVIGLFALAWLVSIACYRSAFAGELWSGPLGRAESEVP